MASSSNCELPFYNEAWERGKKKEVENERASPILAFSYGWYDYKILRPIKLFLTYIQGL
jgi:hypothetical protein